MLSGSESLMLVLSALYCKLLVVIGLAFPLSEVISPDIPPFYYNVSPCGAMVLDFAAPLQCKLISTDGATWSVCS